MTKAPVKSSSCSSSGPPTNKETNKRTLFHSNNDVYEPGEIGWVVTSRVTCIEKSSPDRGQGPRCVKGPLQKVLLTGGPREDGSSLLQCLWDQQQPVPCVYLEAIQGPPEAPAVTRQHPQNISH